MSSPKRRIEKDVMELMMSNHEVTLINDLMQLFFVLFKGPLDTPYVGGTWRVRVELPDQYPMKLPSIGFTNKIYHPNIDDASGLVCLDVINQTWLPMFGLLNVFENFLPHLLRYANPSDPLNTEALNLMTKDELKYTEMVKSYVERYASSPALASAGMQRLGDDSGMDDSDLSDVGTISSDEDPAGTLDL